MAYVLSSRRFYILISLRQVTAAGYIPFLDSWVGDSEFTFAIISGVLPPAVSGLFTVFLPRIMRWLGKYQGALTHASLDRAVVARYFAFLVISQLIVFTLIGVVFSNPHHFRFESELTQFLQTLSLKSLISLESMPAPRRYWLMWTVSMQWTNDVDHTDNVQ